MRRLVSDWFNDLREREGLERLEDVGADSETDDLIESDFTFRPGSSSDTGQIEQFDRSGFFESYEDLAPDLVESLYGRSRRNAPGLDSASSRVVIAETQGGEFAAFIWAEALHEADIRVDYVLQIYVLAEYRGLGLARELLFEYLRRAHDEGAREVIIDLPGRALELQNKLCEMGMAPHAGAVRVQLARWMRD